jgi:hypothetical protein
MTTSEKIIACKLLPQFAGYNSGLERAADLVKSIDDNRLTMIKMLRKDESNAHTSTIERDEEISDRGFNEAIDVVLAILNAPL